VLAGGQLNPFSHSRMVGASNPQSCAISNSFDDRVGDKLKTYESQKWLNGLSTVKGAKSLLTTAP
jgi:hypothetical protein